MLFFFIRPIIFHHFLISFSILPCSLISNAPNMYGLLQWDNIIPIIIFPLLILRAVMLVSQALRSSHLSEQKHLRVPGYARETRR